MFPKKSPWEKEENILGGREKKKMMAEFCLFCFFRSCAAFFIVNLICL